MWCPIIHERGQPNIKVTSMKVTTVVYKSVLYNLSFIFIDLKSPLVIHFDFMCRCSLYFTFFFGMCLSYTNFNSMVIIS